MTAAANNKSGAIAGIELRLPASSANLGPGFDSVAIALNLHLRVRAEVANSFAVEARGRDAALCGNIEHNLILDTYREVMASSGTDFLPLALRVENEIPVGKGCGSSAAARLAGIALAVHFGRLGWSDQQIFESAVEREGHADNVAACWLGGFVLVQSNGNGNATRKLPQATRINVERDWPMLLVLSPDGLPTGRSRALLPNLYSRDVVVANVQSAMALVAAYALGRDELFTTAQQDLLHQPYRAKVCPLLPCLQPLAGSGGILAVTLSGAGKSVLLTLRRDVSHADVHSAISERLRVAGLEAELVFTSMAAQGASRTPLPARALAGEGA
jgi:homoserine kinase